MDGERRKAHHTVADQRPFLLPNMEVYLTNNAVKQYRRLNEPTLSRITEGINGLEKEPPEGDIKEMTDSPGVFRLRVGGYRILYTVEGNCIDVFKIARRGQSYKGAGT